MTGTVFIMAKAPFTGEAKTRLAAALGDEAAVRLYAAFLLDTVDSALAAGVEAVRIMCPDDRHRNALVDLVPPEVGVSVQERPGLMAGISAAAAAAQGKPAIITEADSPDLPAAHLRACFAALAGLPAAGIALGPCSDGGYYAVGVRGLSNEVARELFEGETYQSATICQRTAERAEKLGLAVAFGPAWYDVDTGEDLQQLIARVRSSPHGLERTRAALRSAAWA
ncbi:MAG: DUF2064 domain-containing protein [Chloroflexi bacterium]|nr:DUF2064 domain-containing protein [Chloroflexota bacterium]